MTLELGPRHAAVARQRLPKERRPRERTRVILGLVDQVLIAIASAVTGLLGTLFFSVEVAGRLMLALAFMFFAQSLVRSFVGQVLLTHLPRLTTVERGRVVRSAASCALFSGIGVGTVVLLIGLLTRGQDFALLTWGAFVVPILVTQDAYRYSLLAQRRQLSCLAIDVLWAGVQAATLCALWLIGWVTPQGIICTWGAGALVSCIAVVFRYPATIPCVNPMLWLRETRHLSGWLGGASALGQARVLLVANILVGLLSPTAYALLRSLQTVVLQPVANLSVAVSSLEVPRLAEMATTGDARRFRKLLMAVMAVCIMVAAGALVFAVFAMPPILSWYRNGAYVPAKSLVLPVGLVAAAAVVSIPFGMALLAAQRLRPFLSSYLVLFVVSLVGCAVGAVEGGLDGAAWAMAIAQVCALSTQIVGCRCRLGGAARASWLWTRSANPGMAIGADGSYRDG